MTDEEFMDLRDRVAVLDQRFRSYDCGDRPMSPPVKLIRELVEAGAELRVETERRSDTRSRA